MGSGVAGAIRRKGGEEIEREAMAKGPIAPGQAVITAAGRLPASWVIHCAGMAPGERARYEHVRDSATCALRLASEKKLRELAFPAIGAGVGGLTPQESAAALLEAITKESHRLGSVRRILLVAFNEETRQAFESALDRAEGLQA